MSSAILGEGFAFLEDVAGSLGFSVIFDLFDNFKLILDYFVVVSTVFQETEERLVILLLGFCKFVLSVLVDQDAVDDVLL